MKKMISAGLVVFILFSSGIYFAFFMLSLLWHNYRATLLSTFGMLCCLLFFNFFIKIYKHEKNKQLREKMERHKKYKKKLQKS